MAYQIFIGSSTAAKPYARGLHSELTKQTIGGKEVQPVIWEHAFEPGEFTVDGLVREAEACDAAIFIFSQDDFVAGGPKDQVVGERSAREFYVTRDNVIFEMGLFLGRLGKDRVFMVLPQEHSDLHLPTDLKGITYTTHGRPVDGNHSAAMVGCCDAIVRKLSNPKAIPSGPKLLEVFNQLQKDVSTLVTMAKTRAIGTFPSYFKGHICPLVERAQNLWIASDVLTYGAFSEPATYQCYMDIIRNKKKAVKIIVPSANRIPVSIKRQIPPPVWEKRYQKDPEFMRKLSDFAELADTGEDIGSPEQFYQTVVEFQRKKIRHLKRTQNHGITVYEKDLDIPIFLWIADEREAIFSIPVDRTAGNFFEHSFITEDRDLIHALLATWNRYESMT